ncbi:MAG: 16S rRNA (guanine(527)-N(7))-methyltransferase RsmG [Terracidiphilus sp.]
MSEAVGSAGARLNELLAEAAVSPLDAGQLPRFESYLSLFVRWNSRLNLSSVRGEQGILARHFVESIACAQALPAGIRTLLDLGSGAGLPGIPIALCRPEIKVTLAESQGKKAAFLQEAVRVLGLSAAVHAGRAELLTLPFDCVTLRAVDRMPRAVSAAVRLVAPGGWLALMTTEGELSALQAAASTEFSWRTTVPLPGSIERLLALGERQLAGS